MGQELLGELEDVDGRAAAKENDKYSTKAVIADLEIQRRKTRVRLKNLRKKYLKNKTWSKRMVNCLLNESPTLT